jgi:hypothetical protein
VNVQQRFAGKGGKAFDAVDQTCGFAVYKRYGGMACGTFGHFVDQIGLGEGGQRLTTAHIVLGVFVEQVNDGTGVGGVAEIGYLEVEHSHLEIIFTIHLVAS